MSDEQERQPAQESVQQYPPLRRRPRRRRSVYSRPKNKRLLPVMLLVLALLVVAGAMYQRAREAHYCIVINDKPLVALASKDDALRTLRILHAKYAPNAPGVVTFEEGDVTIAPVKQPMPTLSPPAAARALDRQLHVQLTGYAIFVEGSPLMLLDSKEDAAQAISLMLQRGLHGQDGIPTIKQRVTIDLLHVEKDKIGTIPVMTPEQAAAELVHPPRKAYYTVKPGDSFWSIANAHGLLVSDLDKLNPGQSHLLHEGDIIRLPDIPAPVTVVVRKTQ